MWKAKQQLILLFIESSPFFSYTGTESCPRRAACHRASAWSWGLSRSQTSQRNLKTACSGHRHTYTHKQGAKTWIQMKESSFAYSQTLPRLDPSFSSFLTVSPLSPFAIPWRASSSSEQYKPSHHLQLPLVAAWEHSSSSHSHTKSSNCRKGFQLPHTQLSAERSWLQQPQDSRPSPVAVAGSREALHVHKPNKIHLGISSYLLAFPVHSATLIPRWLPGCCISLMHKQPFCCYYKTNYLMHEWP